MIAWPLPTLQNTLKTRRYVVQQIVSQQVALQGALQAGTAVIRRVKTEGEEREAGGGVAC